MDTKLGLSFRVLSIFLAVLTLASVGVLLLWDGFRSMFPPRTHDSVAAFSLAMIAIAYLVYLAARRPPWREMAKALALAAAFLFWAANQFWPNLPQATLFNDLAIALFVLDVFLVILGWPQASQNRFVDVGSYVGGIGPAEPEMIPAEVYKQINSAIEQADTGTAGTVDSNGPKNNRIQGKLEGNALRIVDATGIRREGNLRMLSLLLGVAAGLAGLNYVRLRAKN